MHVKRGEHLMMEFMVALSSPFSAQSRAIGPWNTATPSSNRLPTRSAQNFCAMRSSSCALCVTTFPSNTPAQQHACDRNPIVVAWRQIVYPRCEIAGSRLQLHREGFEYGTCCTHDKRHRRNRSEDRERQVARLRKLCKTTLRSTKPLISLTSTREKSRCSAFCLSVFASS